MTEEQYNRWRGFATRMARTCFPGRDDQDWIAEHVKGILDHFAQTPYATNRPHYETIHTWDQEKGCDEMYLCDWMQEWETDAVYYGTSISEKWMERIEGKQGAEYEHALDDLREEWTDWKAGPVHCCIRAGLDAASDFRSGVRGFTAGDLRKMYPDGVPDWVQSQWQSFDEIPDEENVWL